MKGMQKSTSNAGVIKATMQSDSTKNTGKLEKGKDLRQNPSGGAKAKQSM